MCFRLFLFSSTTTAAKKRREKFCPHRNWCLLKKSRVVFESLISLPFQLLAYNMTSMHAPIERRKLLSSNFKMLNFMSSLSTSLSTTRRAPAAAVKAERKVQNESKSSGYTWNINLISYRASIIPYKSHKYNFVDYSLSESGNGGNGRKNLIQ